MAAPTVALPGPAPLPVGITDTECCDLLDDHTTPCAWKCRHCGGTGRCGCLECGNTGDCAGGCDDGRVYR